MFNLDNFKANIQQSGYIQTNKFKVIVPIPPSIRGLVGGTTSSQKVSELLTFRAEQIKAPGITLNMDQVYRYGIGTQQNMPFSASYTDNVISFISDGRGLIWNFWYLWIRSIFGFAGNDNSGATGLFNSMPNYQVEYKDQYSMEMTIEIYDNFGRVVQRINMYDAYPTSINDTQLGWGDNNNLLRVTVGFTFKEFTIENAGISVPEAQKSTAPQRISPTSTLKTN